MLHASRASALEPWSAHPTKWLAAIVESSDDAIIGKTLDSVIRSWNRGAERVFGYTAEEIVGRSIRVLIPPELQDEEQYIIEKLSRKERISHYETARVRKDGTRIEVSLTASPIEITPSTRSSWTTGRCRTRCSVIKAMHSSTDCSGSTVNTVGLMISPTVLSREDFPARMTLRA